MLITVKKAKDLVFFLNEEQYTPLVNATGYDRYTQQFRYPALPVTYGL
jgi:hypothetical protein